MIAKTKYSSDHGGLWFNSFHRGAPRIIRKSNEKNSSSVSPLLSLDVQLHRSVANSHKPRGASITPDKLSQVGLDRKGVFQSKESWEAWNQQAMRAALFVQEEALAAQRAPEREHGVHLQRIVIRESDGDAALAAFASSTNKVH